MIKGDRRIEVCEHTGSEVVQELCTYGWLCLHSGTVEQDKAEVDKFREDSDILTSRKHDHSAFEFMGAIDHNK